MWKRRLSWISDADVPGEFNPAKLEKRYLKAATVILKGT
jgi:hypothetical protein